MHTPNIIDMDSMASSNQAKLEERLTTLVSIIQSRPIDYVDEKECQRQLEDVLVEHNVVFEREAPIAKGFIDFYFPKSFVGLEVKANKRWSRREIYRQCEDYCTDERISGLVLATGRSQGLPHTIGSKPVRVVYLGEAFL